MAADPSCLFCQWYYTAWLNINYVS